MDKPILVVAVGGNALLQRGEIMSCDNQKKSISATSEALAKLHEKYRLVVVHGNGPQVGLLALQNLAYKDCPPYPFDVLGSETQGMIGYLMQQNLKNVLPKKNITTVLTQVAVDENDPAIADPSKFIGPVYSKEDAMALAEENNWVIKPDGDMWRRVVPSPAPKTIIEAEAIKCLLAQDHIVICGGGGGAPVIQNGEHLTGFEAVIDKDMTASLIAQEIGASDLLILTDGSHACVDWGLPTERKLEAVTIEEISQYSFAAGSMKPKVEACCHFAQTGGTGHIGDLYQAVDVMDKATGTHISK
ncbi:carbamate kinase [Vibrio sp. MACH09]|uniref:carbamate kinase n=1 Tax=unclassified Vibrio TaxID=2614977 RepID=UPI001493CD05|nr:MULTISPECIES: carbamate kinase [unclassified Vibrio]NOI68520.1 carbamate kinase [Vibrio sp. 99-8-1]GLO59520.1 carbamate kinase [Vibrio sp. MACH09]